MKIEKITQIDNHTIRIQTDLSDLSIENQKKIKSCDFQLRDTFPKYKHNVQLFKTVIDDIYSYVFIIRFTDEINIKERSNWDVYQVNDVNKVRFYCE